MYTEIMLNDFRDAFQRVRPDDFSYEGLKVIYNHLLDYEDGCAEKIELNVIAICCDFTECNIEEVLKDYDLESLEELEAEA